MTSTRTGNTTATPRQTAASKNPATTKPRSFLAELGIVGMEPIEPVILAALISGEPLLLIGPHGTGKSYLLARTCEALALRWRHYNASLLNFDDLVGYPLPDNDGKLKYVQTPSSIWDAEAVFIDEISRCRPDIQNKLFPIIHERRVQGIELENLVYRWSAMNPPICEDDDESGYLGSEPLDLALADRFAFVVEVPVWGSFGEEQQRQIIRCSDKSVDAKAAKHLRDLVTSGQTLLSSVRSQLEEPLAEYVRLLTAMLREATINLSARRAGILFRNIVAVHTARLLLEDGAKEADSALAALVASIPDRALGTKVDRLKLLVAHREAWKIAAFDVSDPRRLVLDEPDPIRKIAIAVRLANSIPRFDFSAIIHETLNALPDGARHAAMCFLFESDAAGCLLAAIADQYAGQYSLAALPRDCKVGLTRHGERRKVWDQITGPLPPLLQQDPDAPLLRNLLLGLFCEHRIKLPHDVEEVIASWLNAREKLQGVAA